MKQSYEVDVEEIKRNIILEVDRYISNVKGYQRDLLEYNIQQILEQSYKNMPTDYKGNE